MDIFGFDFNNFLKKLGIKDMDINDLEDEDLEALKETVVHMVLEDDDAEEIFDEEDIPDEEGISKAYLDNGEDQIRRVSWNEKNSPGLR